MNALKSATKSANNGGSGETGNSAASATESPNSALSMSRSALQGLGLVEVILEYASPHSWLGGVVLAIGGLAVLL